MKMSEIGPAVLGGSLLVVGEFRAWDCKVSKSGKQHVESFVVLQQTRMLTLRACTEINGHPVPSAPPFKVGDRIVVPVENVEAGSGFVARGKRPERLEP